MFFVLENFRNLPRHQFGNLQSKMFPAYFALVGTCCAISVASFGYLHPWKSSTTAEIYQLGFLLSAFAFNLTNLFVFTPMTIEVNLCLACSLLYINPYVLVVLCLWLRMNIKSYPIHCLLLLLLFVDKRLLRT